MRTRAFVVVALFSVFSFSTLQAQDDPGPGSVTVFSESGDRFTLYLNGQVQNATASERVVANNVKEVPISFRIVFADGAIPEITKRGIRLGTNCLYAIVKNKKGERVLRVGDCTNEPTATTTTSDASASSTVETSTSSPTATPDQLSASYTNGIISINDGRTLTVKKVKANGMTYPRVIMTALTGAKVSISYDSNNETFSAETPLQYEVKDFSNNNAYFTLTVDEGGPAKTWKVKLQNANGYDLKIE